MKYLKLLAFLLSISALLVLWTLKKDAGLDKGQNIETLNLADLKKTNFYSRLIPLSSDVDHYLSGVVKKDQNSVGQGFNLYTDELTDQVQLVDNNGEFVKKWLLTHVRLEPEHWLQFALLKKNGDLVVNQTRKAIHCVDGTSKQKWSVYGEFHHEIAEGADNVLYALKSVPKIVTLGELAAPVLVDYLVALSPEGKVVEEKDLFSLLDESVKKKVFEGLSKWPDRKKILNNFNSVTGQIAFDSPGDVMHGNSLQFISQGIRGINELPSLLISFRDLNMIALYELPTHRFVHYWGAGSFEKQHSARYDPQSGSIFVFDNRPSGKRSRVVNLDKSGKIIDVYGDDAEEETFFSPKSGAVQILSNGNLLITVSKEGRVFEINKDKAVVWDYFNEVVFVKELGRYFRKGFFNVSRYGQY